MNFNLEYYKAFFYAAKYNSFSKAAQTLYLTQPAISQSIRRLEEELKVSLFTRTSHGMLLTPEGQLLYSHVEKAFDLLTAGQTKLARFSSLEDGDIFIGATETGLIHYVLPNLAEFQKQYPKITVHIKGCHSHELMLMLKDGKIDVAVGVTPIQEDFALSVIYLQEFQDIFIAGKGFSHLSGQTLQPYELLHYPLAISSSGSSFSNNLMHWFQQQQITLKPQFSVITTSFILPFLQNNLAIACVPDLFARQWQSFLPSLFTLQLTQLPPKRSIFLATNDAMPLGNASREFIKLMLAARHTSANSESLPFISAT